MNYTVRIATQADIPGMTELLIQLFSIEEDFSPDPQKQEAGLALLLDNPDMATLFVAEARHGNMTDVQEDSDDDPEIIGMCSLFRSISTSEGSWVGIIEDVIINEPFRGKGIGSALLEAAETFAESEGFTRIQLLTQKQNQQALTFYRKHHWYDTDLIVMRRSFL